LPGGANAGSATPISSLPYSDSDTSPGAAGLWYVYTSPTPAVPNELGVFVYAAGVNNVRVRVFSPDSVTAFPANDPITGAHNIPIQLPITAGVSYYLQVFNAGAYTLSAIAGPSASAPAGSIFVNDDVAGWPLALLSGTDGSALQ